MAAGFGYYLVAFAARLGRLQSKYHLHRAVSNLQEMLAPIFKYRAEQHDLILYKFEKS